MDRGSKKQLLFIWVAFLAASLILFSAFLAGVREAQPATIDGLNILVLVACLTSAVAAIVYFRKWLFVRRGV